MNIFKVYNNKNEQPVTYVKNLSALSKLCNIDQAMLNPVFYKKVFNINDFTIINLYK